MRKRAETFAVALILIAVVTGPVRAEAPHIAALGGRVVDLTHPFAPGVLTWPINRPFEITTDFAGVSAGGYYYAANSFCMAEHTGTHVDAPRHFSATGSTLEGVPLERLIGPAVVVDVSAAARTDRDLRIGVDAFEAWEGGHGRIAAGTIVLLRTGFGAFWDDKARYAGTAETGKEAVEKLHFPGLHPGAAAWIVARGVSAIGLDTPSIDHGPSTDFAAHVVLAEADIPVFENVANLDRVPTTGSTVIALPMKLAGGSGGPLRIVAVVPVDGE